MKIPSFVIWPLLALALASVPPLRGQTGEQPEPQMKAVLDAQASLDPKPLETLSAEEARKQPSVADGVKKLMKQEGKKPEPVGDTDDLKVTLGDHKVAVRVYTPKGPGPFPAILYIHGGGWVIADLDTYDGSARALCNAANAIVISTHYRQAPEYKFPASHEDVFGVYQWAVKNEKKLNYDAKKLAVVGESAGGNMAAAVCLMAKERGVQMPVHQVLVYPVADLTKMDTPSYQENAMAKPLNKTMMEWFGKQELAKPEDAQNPLLSPLLAKDLSGLPSATVITAQIDPLRSEGEKFAEALKQAGVSVHQKTFAGVTHEFFGTGAVVDKAKEAVQMAAADLQAAFAK